METFLSEQESETDAVDVELAKRQLDAFLVQNPKLEQLNAELGRFNIFRTLNIEVQEIRHSNTLRWLLDPAESHGLGDRFLRRFISRLLLENRGIKTNLSPAKIELMEFGYIDVRREWNNIDIFARNPANHWILLIENKIRSKESAGQLLKYADTVRKEFPNDELIPVFLTVEGDEPSDEGSTVGYVALSHDHILEIANSIFEQYSGRMADDAKIFLDHYLRILRRITMQDEVLKNLCKEIYSKHKEAIELIIKFGSSSQVLDALNEYVDSLPDISYKKVTSNRIWWIPKSMSTLLATEDMNGWGFLDKQYPLYWWLYHRKRGNSIQLCLEVGPITNPARRKQLLELLRGEGFTFGDWAYKEDARYTRVFSETKGFPMREDGEPDDSIEAVKAVAKTLWAKADTKMPQVLNAIKKLQAKTK